MSHRRIGEAVVPWLITLLACAPGRAVELPRVPAETWIVSESEARGLAVGVLTAGPYELVAGSEAFSLEALAYQVSATDLGVEPGPLRPGEDCARSCVLVAPDKSFQLSAAGAWIETAPSEALLSWLFPSHRCDPSCETTSAEMLPFPGLTHVTAALPDGPDRWTLVSAEGHYTLTPDGIERTCASGPSGDADRGPDGQLYVAGGNFIHVFDSVSCTTTATIVLPIPAQRIAVAEGPPSRIYVAERVEVDPQRPETWRARVHVGSTGGPFTALRDIVFDDSGRFLHGPDGKLLYTAETEELIWIDGERAVVERLPDAQPIQIEGSAYSEARGPVLAIRKLGLLARPDAKEFGRNERATWVEHSSGADVFEGQRGVVLDDDRIFVIAKAGVLQQWVDGLGACPYGQVPVGDNVSPRNLVLATDGSLIVVDAEVPDDGHVSAVKIRRQTMTVCAR
ncbi:MAG: hypothetical protein HYV07_23705 [Deltaproteobacteria bacterium]|nr:hypothetical protein [Deltaproteobacteria bacterium]